MVMLSIVSPAKRAPSGLNSTLLRGTLRWQQWLLSGLQLSGAATRYPGLSPCSGAAGSSARALSMCHHEERENGKAQASSEIIALYMKHQSASAGAAQHCDAHSRISGSRNAHPLNVLLGATSGTPWYTVAVSGWRTATQCADPLSGAPRCDMRHTWYCHDSADANGWAAAHPESSDLTPT